jgi:hypothetical protein
MRFAAFIFLVLALSLTGCRSSQTTTTVTPSPRPTSATVKSKIDVCNLLTSDDLKEQQGEAYTEAQRSDRLDGEFIVAQCYYAMPTTVNSVVVSVTTATDQPAARSPKAFWEQTFSKYDEKESGGKAGREQERKERERAQEKTQPAREREEGEEKEASPPQPVKDLGDEAFWVGSPIGGALYVLRGDLFIRVSVGGAGDQKSKLHKSIMLARKILRQFPGEG